MVREGMTHCPICGKKIKYYDSVRRIVRTKNSVIQWICINRMICTGCGSVHRQIPWRLIPYKQYDYQTVKGFILGDNSILDLEYEDYPCEMTIKRWLSEYSKEDYYVWRDC